MSATAALILVDIQNDFCPKGALAIEEGDRIIPVVNHLQKHFKVIVACQDWHPPNHVSFIDLWPPHCIQDSKGAEFHPDLDTSRIQKIFHKGIDKNIDSYSAFFDNAHHRSTGLETYLRSIGVEDIYLVGLATDYCIKYTALDAVNLNFNVYVIVDACRGIDLKKGDIAKALDEMRMVGVKLIHSQELGN